MPRQFAVRGLQVHVHVAVVMREDAGVFLRNCRAIANSIVEPLARRLLWVVFPNQPARPARSGMRWAHSSDKRLTQGFGRDLIL
jgi:hypothetical protein